MIQSDDDWVNVWLTKLTDLTRPSLSSSFFSSRWEREWRVSHLVYLKTFFTFKKNSSLNIILSCWRPCACSPGMDNYSKCEHNYFLTNSIPLYNPYRVVKLFPWQYHSFAFHKDWITGVNANYTRNKKLFFKITLKS